MSHARTGRWGGKVIWPIVVLVASVAGCATSGESVDDHVRGPRTSDGALLTLDGEPRGPVWRNWTPAAEPDTPPAAFDASVRAFDYWQVDDPDAIEAVWSALFPVLDGVRSQVETRPQRESLQLMLEAIEPDSSTSPTRMDLTFVVSADGSDRFEGFACRLYRRLGEKGVTPVVTVLLLRRPGEARTPSRIAVWAAPRFEEADSVTALFERRDATWRQAVVGGLHLPVGEERPTTEADEAGSVAARLLTKSIWKPYAGNAYLESPQSGASSDRPRPDDIEPALGLEVKDRQIEQVYSNTTFPPRADLDDL